MAGPLSSAHNPLLEEKAIATGQPGSFHPINEVLEHSDEHSATIKSKNSPVIIDT